MPVFREAPAFRRGDHVTNNRHLSPEHEKWHVRVEGQVRDCITQHPRWFKFKDDSDKSVCINSLAKRIVGEIVASVKGHDTR
jgi:hypothetical protein